MIRKSLQVLGILGAYFHSVDAQIQSYKIQNTPNSGIFIQTNQTLNDSKVDTLRISSTNRSIAKYVVASQHERVSYTVNQTEPTYRYISKPKRYINDFALGLYYSQESFTNNLSWDTLRFRNSDSKFVPGSQMNKVSGFGFHFLFGGRKFIPQTQLGSFNWGLGMDFNHFRRGPKTQVAFNNDLEDKGFTRLETSAVTFHGIARYEKRVGLLYPYAAAKVGFNFYSTQQYTEAHRTSTNYESTNSENISTDITPYFAYELGIRAKLAPGISAFASYENRTGNQLEVVNISQSTFNGFEYKNDVKTVDYKIENIKFGFLFDLSSVEREKEVVSPYRLDTTYITNLVVFDTVWLEEPQVRSEVISISDPRLKGYYLSKCKNCLCDTNAKTNNTRIITTTPTEINKTNNTNSELKPAPSKSSTPTPTPTKSSAEINTQSSGGAIQATPRPSSSTTNGSGTIKAFPGIKPPPAIKKPKA